MTGSALEQNLLLAELLFLMKVVVMLLAAARAEAEQEFLEAEGVDAADP